MAALLANIGNTAIANGRQIIYRSHPEATIEFQGKSIVIRLCYWHVSLKYCKKLLKNRKYGNPVGKYWQNYDRKCSSDYLQISPEAAIGFQGQNIVIRLLFPCFFKISQKITESHEYGNPVGKYWQHCNRKCSSNYLRISPRSFNRVSSSK